MSFEDAYKLDFDTATVAIDGGVKVTVRRLQSKESQQLRRKLERPFERLQRLPDDAAEDILVKQLAGAVLVGWEGVTDKDGKAIPFSTAAADKMLREFPAFREDVIAVAASRDAFKAARDEEVRGN